MAVAKHLGEGLFCKPGQAQVLCKVTLARIRFIQFPAPMGSYKMICQGKNPSHGRKETKNQGTILYQPYPVTGLNLRPDRRSGSEEVSNRVHPSVPADPQKLTRGASSTRLPGAGRKNHAAGHSGRSSSRRWQKGYRTGEPPR
jgi:hypothetical protein